jgi:hypothetical protein
MKQLNLISAKQFRLEAIRATRSVKYDGVGGEESASVKYSMSLESNNDYSSLSFDVSSDLALELLPRVGNIFIVEVREA